MKILYILGAVALILFLLGQIRVGAQLDYGDVGARVWLKLGCFRIQVVPMKKKAKPERTAPKKAKKPKKSKTEPTEEQPKPSLKGRAGGALDYARALLPVLLEAGGCLYRKLQVDTLDLELIVGADDPADAAMRYGQASAILGAMWYPLTQTFHVKDGRARTRLDFDAREMTLLASASMTIKVGQILWIGLYFGTKTLKQFVSVRNRRKNVKQQDRKAA